MSVGFGFSAGDFISALELVAKVVDALRESGLASTEYRGLIAQLELLKTALRKVNRIELDDNQYAEGIALRQAAAQCQRTIDEFWKKNIQKYQPSLNAGGSGNRVRDGWMKVKWALCQKDDLAKFKADLVGHTESINLIMTTIQMAATRIDSKKNDQHHRSLAGKLQDSYFGCMQQMTVVLERVSTGIQQGKELLEMTTEVIQTNVQIFQVILNIQNLISRIPGQVDRQQPVYFVDALGRHAPFHLEFILSAEALTSVLQSNFKNVGSGAKKIGRGEFAIQDSATKKDIDLSSPWETCFRPGQRVDMSMIFNSARASKMYCPACHESNSDDFVEDEDVECRKCTMIYRRSVSWTTPEPLPDFPITSSQMVSRAVEGEADKVLPLAISIPLKRKLPYDDDDAEDVVLFRRVRIKTSTGRSTEDSRPHSRSYDILHRLLNGMQNHNSSWPFLQPVNRDEVQDYYDVIKEPMDFSTMEYKLEADYYATAEDFISDAKLVFDNCRKYNNERTPYAKCANKLEKYMWQQLKATLELLYLEP